MFMIWDSRLEGLQLFWLNFQHWSLLLLLSLLLFLLILNRNFLEVEKYAYKFSKFGCIFIQGTFHMNWNRYLPLYPTGDCCHKINVLSHFIWLSWTYILSPRNIHSCMKLLLIFSIIWILSIYIQWKLFASLSVADNIDPIYHPDHQGIGNHLREENYILYLNGPVT